MNYNALDKSLVKIYKINSEKYKCSHCSKIIDKRSRYVLAYPTSAWYSNVKKYKYYHIKCFIEIINNSSYFKLIKKAKLGKICKICGNRIGEADDVVTFPLGWRNFDDLVFHKACLIALIYKKINKKIPNKIKRELVLINI